MREKEREMGRMWIYRKREGYILSRRNSLDKGWRWILQGVFTNNEKPIYLGHGPYNFGAQISYVQITDRVVPAQKEPNN